MNAPDSGNDLENDGLFKVACMALAIILLVFFLATIATQAAPTAGLAREITTAPTTEIVNERVPAVATEIVTEPVSRSATGIVTAPAPRLSPASATKFVNELVTVPATRIATAPVDGIVVAPSIRSASAPATRPSSAPTTEPATKPTSKLTYKLGSGSADWDPKMTRRIVESMDAAIAIYRANGDFEKSITATYNPGTPTADANWNGNIRFGGQIGTRTALHEIAHTLGVGQHADWNKLIKDGLWTGKYATAQLKEFDGPDAVLHADRQHFWPYGLNFDKEGGEENFKRHVKMITAFQKDLAITR